jgi:predicted ATPase
MAGGLAQIRDGIADYRSNSAELGSTFLMALLSEALIRAAQFDEAQTVVNEALSLAQSNGERYYEAELHRLNGVLVLERVAEEGEGAQLTVSAQDQAEGCFERAISLSGQQGARMLELRVLIELARLWQRRGKAEVARQRLEILYQRFTEGFGSADLQAAKTLLDTLA